MNRAVVGLGSNINPEENLRAALAVLGRAQKIIKLSTLRWTAPLGPVQDQPHFLNGAVLLETADSQDDLVASLKRLEVAMGRPRGGDRWGPRTLDLDLVVWNGQVLDREMCQSSFLSDTIVEVLGGNPMSLHR